MVAMPPIKAPKRFHFSMPSTSSNSSLTTYKMIDEQNDRKIRYDLMAIIRDKRVCIYNKQYSRRHEKKCLTSVAPTYMNVPAVRATIIASTNGVATLLMRTPIVTPSGPTQLNNANQRVIWSRGIDVFRKATNSAIDSAGWCSPILAA
jgi:hypothetical protein